jgi:hypothetical protein
MKPVGIIASPVSGVPALQDGAMAAAHAERVDALVRILRALDALDVSSARIMPDPTGLAEQALAVMQGDLALLDAAPLALPDLTGTRRDTERAAAAMRDLDFGCIVVLGGDGTCRAVAGECGDVPLIPISTGPSSAFPGVVEGTLAGLAAAACAAGAIDDGGAVRRAPQLRLLRDGEPALHALVAIAVIDAADVGAGMASGPGGLVELFLAQGRPGAIGLSAIGAALRRAPAGQGLRIQFAGPRGDALLEVLAPLAPGCIATLAVGAAEPMRPGAPIDLRTRRGVLALDGDCELQLDPTHRWSVVLDPHGPRIVHVERALDEASARGFFLRDPGLPAPWFGRDSAPVLEAC